MNFHLELYFKYRSTLDIKISFLLNLNQCGYLYLDNKMAASSENKLVKLTSSMTVEETNKIFAKEMLLNKNGVDSDLVFICGDKEIAYPREILSLVFPLVSEVVPKSNECCDMYLRKDAKIFLTLDGVEANTFERIINYFLIGDDNLIDVDPSELFKIAEMLGARKILQLKYSQAGSIPTIDRVVEEEVINYSDENISEKMLLDAVDELENLDEASEYLGNEQPFKKIIVVEEDIIDLNREESEVKQFTLSDVVNKSTTNFYGFKSSETHQGTDISNVEQPFMKVSESRKVLSGSANQI